MTTLTHILNELLVLETKIDALYDDLLRALATDYGVEIIDEKICNWSNLSWDEFSSYLFCKGIDLQDSPKNWKSLFNQQKESISALKNYQMIS